MNGNLRDKHLLVGLFGFLCLVLLLAGSFANGWDKILDWALDKAGLILGGILTLLVQRAVGTLDRSNDSTRRANETKNGANVTPAPASGSLPASGTVGS